MDFFGHRRLREDPCERQLRRIRRSLAHSWLVVIVGLSLPGPAHAEIEAVPLHFESVTAGPAKTQKNPDVQANAGAHPDVMVSMGFGNVFQTGPVGGPKDELYSEGAPVWERWDKARVAKLRIDFPPGLVGNPAATPQCTWAQFQAKECPEESVVGTIAARATPLLLWVQYKDVPFELPIDDQNPWGYRPRVFNLNPAGSPHPDAPGLLGMQLDWGFMNWNNQPFVGGSVSIPVPIRLHGGVSPHLYAEAEIPATIFVPQLDPPDHAVRLTALELTLFGSPDPSRPPFLSMPSRCGPAVFGFSATSASGVVVKSHAGFEVSGCGDVPFSPVVSVVPADAGPGVAGAVRTRVEVPSESFPRAQGNVRQLSVRLPDGVGLSAGVAGGLELCSGDQFKVGSSVPAVCPAGSRVGRSLMKSPLLEGVLEGGAFLGERLPGPLLGFPLYVEVASVVPDVRIKLAGSVTVSAEGDVVATFRDLPQLPFSVFELEFRGKPGAVMVLPSRCGTTFGQAVFASWASNAPLSVGVPLTVSGDGGVCAPRFAPSLSVGGSLVGGESGDLRLRVARRDGDGVLTGMNVSMPSGFMGDLTKAEMCSDGAAESGTCGESSRVGDVVVAVGPEDDAVTLPGRLYLTGPYVAGDVAGLSIVVPARVGPLDLGTVVMRAGIGVRSSDAGLEIRSGALPTMLAGVPLQISAVDLQLTRPGFIRNPTGCGEKVFRGSFDQLDGAPAFAQATVSATGCDRLGAGVEVSARVGAGGAPSFGAEIRPRKGAAMSEMNVSLPDGLSISLPKVGAACAIAQARVGSCDRAATVGSARAATPVIGEPLSGSVVLVASTTGGLPGLLVQLRNAAGTIKLELLGEVSFVGGSRIKTTFQTPDVPLDSFQLSLHQDGVLMRLPVLCNGVAKLDVDAKFHNGKQQSLVQPVNVAGCSATGASKPVLTAKLTKAATTKPKLTLNLKTTAKARKLQITLPKGVTAEARNAGARVLPKSAKVTLERRTITITARKPTTRITLTLTRGVTVTKALRTTLAKPRKLKIAAKINGKPHKPARMTITR